VPELSLRLCKGRGRIIHADLGCVQAGLIGTESLDRRTKTAEMEGARLTERMGKAQARPWGGETTLDCQSPQPKANGAGIALRENHRRAIVVCMINLDPTKDEGFQRFLKPLGHVRIYY